MTEEEFYALPPERQAAMMKQMQQSKAMKVDYGAMQNPYGASPQRDTGPPPQQRQQQEQMPTQQQGGGMQMPPGMNQMMNQLGKKAAAVPASGAGSALTATEAAAFTPAYAPQSLAIGGSTANAGVGTAAAGNVGSAGAGTAAGGGGGGGGMMAAAGPWAALAAAVVANETYQNKEGNRPEDFGDHAKAMLSGEVLEMDAEKYLSDVPGAEFMASMGNPEGIIKNIGKSLKPWDWF